MKIKQMIKWNWQNSYMGLIVLYGVFILLYLFAFAVNVSAGGETSTSTACPPARW